MADGSLDTQDGARICNGLSIMRSCLELQKLERLESRMDDIAARLAHGAPAQDKTMTHEFPAPSELTRPTWRLPGEVRPSLRRSWRRLRPPLPPCDPSVRSCG